MVVKCPSTPDVTGASSSAMRSTTQRLHDAVHQPLAEAEEIEIAVQIARESDERAAVVVAIAVVDAIEPGLNRVLQRPAEQHDHERREQRDDGVADRIPAEEDLADQPEDDGVDRGDGRQRRGVDQRRA